ncbi:MAG: PAS domain-containing sensor histidine kinase [Bacteroidia bacterium]
MVVKENIVSKSARTGLPAYEQILDSVPALITYIDKNLIYRYANDAYHHWFGHNPDSLCGRYTKEVMGEKVFAKLEPYFKRALVGETVNFQLELQYETGLKYVDATYIPDIDPNGYILGFTAHVNDITEKKKTEFQLQKKTYELQDYLENATIGLHWVDENGIIIWANNADFEMLGYKAEEYIGQPISLFHENKEALDEVLSKLKNKEIINKFETILNCKDGTKKNVIISTSALWENDKFIHTRCFTMDITEKRQAEELMSSMNTELEEKVVRRTEKLLRANEQLIRSEERYYKMVDEVEDYAIIMLDKNGIILNWNAGAEKIKGYTAQEILGKSYSLFFTEEDKKKNLPEQTLLRAVTQGKAKNEGLRVRKDGTTVWCSTVITALHGKLNNEIIGFTKVTRDLTTRKTTDDKLNRYANQLEIKNKELEQFVYVVSHDLQEPLRKIQTFNKLIINIEPDNLTEKGKDYLSRSISAANRMGKLIDELLNYSRTTALEKKFESYDLNLLVTEVINSYIDKPDKSKVVFKMNDLPTLCVIPFQIQQVFHNLISNSIKYKKPGKKLIVKINSEIAYVNKLLIDELNPTKKYCVIHYSDNGIGFDSQYSDLIFEIFQRLHNKNDYPGTGIGLSICKKIVQNHHGAIRAAGIPGKGAQFSIYLPFD